MDQSKLFSLELKGRKLPVAPLPGAPLVEVYNSRRVFIENHQSIAAYQDDKIIVKVRDGNIAILGGSLQLIRMSKHQLVITGDVFSVQFGKNI